MYPNKNKAGSKGGPPPKASKPPVKGRHEEVEDEEDEELESDEEEGAELEEEEGAEETEGDSEVSDEEFETALNVVVGKLQSDYASKVAGPHGAVGDHEKSWIDELVLPMILTFISWWRNRKVHG